jgi:hypothetical protein
MAMANGNGKWQMAQWPNEKAMSRSLLKFGGGIACSTRPSLHWSSRGAHPVRVRR